MDGNGRWAESRGLPRSEGHCAGVDVVKTVVRACLERRIAVLSVWAFGSENWTRPETEVSFLMQLFVQALTREITELHQNGVCLRFTGNRTQLLPALQEEMRVSEALTASNDQLIMNVVINYGGKWDVVQAAKSLVGQVLDGGLSIDEIDEDRFSQQLNTGDLPYPDLLIRTGGERRISNFFLWQLAYTELYFTDVYWPDFTIGELDCALEWFALRERRYGRTSKQLLEKQGV